VANDKVFPFSLPLCLSTQRTLQLSQKVAKIEQVCIEDLALDFTIPGYDIE
jgi:E3 ubiquitin-protein ligase TRIP12